MSSTKFFQWTTTLLKFQVKLNQTNTKGLAHAGPFYYVEKSSECYGRMVNPRKDAPQIFGRIQNQFIKNPLPKCNLREGTVLLIIVNISDFTNSIRWIEPTAEIIHPLLTMIVRFKNLNLTQLIHGRYIRNMS